MVVLVAVVVEIMRVVLGLLDRAIMGDLVDTTPRLRLRVEAEGAQVLPEQMRRETITGARVAMDHLRQLQDRQ